MFKIGDRIRTNRSAAVRYGIIHEVDADGGVFGEFDDGLPFIRDASIHNDIVLASDDEIPPRSDEQSRSVPDPQPGDRVMVTWPNGRRYGTVHPCGSYIGRFEALAGWATVEILEPRS